MRSFLKKFRLLVDQRGATLVEFGLVAGPFILMLLGIMDLGYRGYVDTVSKSVLHRVARDASTGEMTTAEIKQQVRDGLDDLVLKDAVINVTSESYYAFTNVGKPEEALPILEKAVAHGGSYEARSSLAASLNQLGRHAEAVTIHLGTIEQFP